MPRFTISHHTGSKDGDHYDLMLEHGEAELSRIFGALALACFRASK